MSEVLNSIREKYPVYRDVPDDELALGIADKFPVYMENDPAFKDEVLKAQRQTSFSGPSKITPPGTAQPMLGQTGTAAIPQAFPIAEQKIEEAKNAPVLTLQQAEQIASTPYVSLPRGGQPGTATRAASEFAAGLVEQTFLTPQSGPLGLALAVPGLRQAVALALTASAAKTAGQELGEASVTGNVETATHGALTGALALLGGIGVGKDISQSNPAVFARDAIAANTADKIVPIGDEFAAGSGQKQLPAPRTRMPEFTQSTLEPEPLKLALPAPGESGATAGLLSGSPEAAPQAGHRIVLPIEPESAKLARQIWSNPIDIEAQVEGADALRQITKFTEETKTKGQPYEPPSVTVDLAQLEKSMQKNTVSKVESWADQVIREKLGGASANPYFDPEFLAAAAVKAAVLVKRGVTEFGAWSNEMRKQFGSGMEDRLPDLFRQAMQGAPRAVTEQKPESVTPTMPQSTSATIAQDSGPNATSSLLQKTRATISSLMANGDVREAMVYTKDAADNQANLLARQIANDVRSPMESQFGKNFDSAGDALTFVVESQGDKAKLAEMRQKLMESDQANPKAKNRAISAINFAESNWDELSTFANDHNLLTDAQVSAENAAGIDTLKRKGYVMHAQDIEEGEGFLRGSNAGSGAPTSFRKVRTFDTYADSIAAGYKPHTLNALDLLESRLRYGQRMINNRAWAEGLRGMTDATGNPIGADPITVKRADGSTYQEAPNGYHLETVGRQQVAIRNGFEGLFNALTDPSAWSRNAAGRGFIQSVGSGKSLALLLDTFHLGRVAFWESLIKMLGIKTFKAPFPSYSKGVTLLDFSEQEIRRMAESGEIPKEWTPDLVESRHRLDLALKTGFNVGHISDSLHQELIRMIPLFGDFNKWLFDQFQRGAMTESWLLEYERLRRARPEMDQTEAARQVSVDLNTRFGNLGRQGWFTSRTSQDTARSLFLAPQWNEGLIKSEIGAVKQIGQTAVDLAKGKSLYMGLLGRSVAGMALAQFAANQIINYATRGHPTWQNPEEGWGAKLSAWVPDLVGKGPGFFLHPLGLAAEITHLLTKSYERSSDARKTMMDFLRSRASVAMRPVLTFITNTDFLGRTLKPGAVWGEVAKNAVPLPIPTSAAVGAGKQILTGQHGEQFPGQFQKQIMASFGVKTDQAPGPEQRIRALATEFNKAKGKEPQGEYAASDYLLLVQAMKMKNEVDAKKALETLVETKGKTTIIRHFNEWPERAFTASRLLEGQFRRSLTPEQMQQYQAARKDRHEIANTVKRMLQSVPNKPQAP